MITKFAWEQVYSKLNLVPRPSPSLGTSRPPHSQPCSQAFTQPGNKQASTQPTFFLSLH